MTHEQIREFFALQGRYWRDRERAGLAAGHTPDGTIVSPIFRTVKGADGIADSYRALFEIFPDWDYRGAQLLIDGDRVAESFTAAATHKGEFMGLEGTGKRFTIEGVRLYEMRDGLIAHERRYYDFTGC
jgi:ketosteroid isomerase-like protein